MKKAKFCGINKMIDAIKAIDAGASYIGFVVLIKNTKRSISLNKFEGILTELKNNRHNFQAVAVVDKPNLDNVSFIVQAFRSVHCHPILQFHNSFDKKYLESIRAEFPDIEIWQVLKYTEIDTEILQQNSILFDRILLDNKSIEDKRGNLKGSEIDFEAVKKLKSAGFSPIISGGLNPANIKIIQQKTDLDLYDVSSGIENESGRKDEEKMKIFMMNLNNSNINYL